MPHEPNIELARAAAQIDRQQLVPAFAAVWGLALYDDYIVDAETVDMRIARQLARLMLHCGHLDLRVTLRTTSRARAELPNRPRWSRLSPIQRARHDLYLDAAMRTIGRLPLPPDSVAFPPGDMNAYAFMLDPEPHDSPIGRYVPLPPNFSFAIPRRLACSGFISSHDEVRAVQSLGLTTVVSLTAEERLPRHWFGSSLHNFRIDVADYSTPTTAQLDAFVALVAAASPTQGVLVHCMFGQGRTGTFVAAAFVALGYALTADDGVCRVCWAGIGLNARDRGAAVPGTCRKELCSLRRRRPVMTAGEAIYAVRRLRPHSIETAEQEGVVRDYHDELLSRRR